MKPQEWLEEKNIEKTYFQMHLCAFIYCASKKLPEKLISF
jgi:hypothetical protein